MVLTKAIHDFEQLVARYGTDVTVVYRTPKLDSNGGKVRDSKNKPVFTETVLNLRCMLHIMDGTENLVNNAVLQQGDAAAHFMLKDAVNLNKDSTLKVDYGNGLTYTWKMLKPMPKHVYISVQLKTE
jgi:hypothetical protein